MGCALTQIGDGVAFVCGNSIAACACNYVATALCDYPMGKGRTCDAPLCERCRVRQGGALRDIDFCPPHALMAQGRTTAPTANQLALWPTPPPFR